MTEPLHPPPTEPWDDLRQLWQTAPDPADLAHLDRAAALASRRRDERFERTIRWRNAREMLACAVLVASGLWEALRPGPWLLRLGFLLMAAAGVWIARWMLTAGSSLPPPDPAASTSAHLAHESAQLERQIDLLGRVRSHYLAPFAPSLLAIDLHFALALLHPPPGRSPSPGSFVALQVVLSATFVSIDALNRRAARRLRQRQRELLPAASPDEPRGD